MSDAIQSVPGVTSLLCNLGFFDDDGFGRNVLMEAAAASLYAFDLVYDFSAFNDFTEDSVAPTIGGRGSEVQEVIVGDVDEELCGSRVWVAGARHGQRVAVVLQAVIGFVLNGSLGGFLFHVGIETAALNHEVVDDTMEDCAVVKAIVDIGQE